MAERPHSASARALLLTVLGEFCLRHGGEAWTGTLVESLRAVGVEEKAARQAVARTAAAGVLTSERHGRRMRWSLTPSGQSLLEEGTNRIYGFLDESRTWDGQWLVVSIAVPESQRTTRHQLRTRLQWLGLGSPSPGLWVIPDAEKDLPVREVLSDLGLLDKAFAWVGRRPREVDHMPLLQAAWDLADLRERYEAFITEFDCAAPESDAEVFTAQVRLLQAWRQFPFLDPEVPAELLDDDWPGRRAATVFRERRAQWQPAADAAWLQMDADAERRM